jgi:ElaB/YqjD/DUF883 family membrane-anchored ribosome-binding protein
MKPSAVSETSRRYQRYAANELKSLLASSEELLESLGDQTGDAVEELRGKLSSSIEKARQRLGDSAEAVSSSAQDASEAAQSYFERNPWTAVAIGTLAGVAVGVVLTSGTDLVKRFR